MKIILIIIAHLMTFYMGYNFGKRVHKWKINHPKKS